MKTRTKISEVFHHRARELVGELSRMWQAAPARSRLDAYDCVGRDLGVSSRKVKALIYDEETLPMVTLFRMESREQSAWSRLEDEFLQLAEYCRDKAELARIKRTQAEIDFTPHREDAVCLSSTGYARTATS